MKTIKKIKTLVLFILLTFVVYNSYSQSTKTVSPEQLIVGTWVHENEPENRWKFTNDGICYWLNENNTIEMTFSYSISYTSPQCGYVVRTNIADDYYLKLINQEDNSQSCYEILGLDEQTLSINLIGTSNRALLIKQ